MQTSALEAATNEAHTQLTTVQGNALLDYGVRMIVIRELCQALLTHFPSVRARTSSAVSERGSSACLK